MTLREEEIRAELDRIVGSELFKRSARLSRFVRFAVESTLAGKPEHLKEYRVGVEVYEKGADFDPRIDSTVRVEAARLRSKLREYYEMEGRANPLRIELPKHGYAPQFRRVQPPASLDRRRVPDRVVWAGGLVVLALAGAGVIAQLGTRSKTSAPPRIRPLTTWQGSELQPCFSPDGKHIAMVWSGEKDDNLDIYVKTLSGSLVRLTTDPAPDLSPAWSPDGRSIAFARSTPTGVNVYVVPAQGGTERLAARLQRTEVLLVRRFLDWLPNGQALVVSDRDSTNEPYGLFQVSVETGERRRLTSPPQHSYGDSQPLVSPDGDMLAFERALAFLSGDIHIVPIHGGDPRRLTSDGWGLGGFSWSEDGRSIIFSSERIAPSGMGSLWRIRNVRGASPGQPEPALGTGGQASMPSVARSGHLLAYESGFQDMNVWRARADGQAPPEMIISSTRDETQPDYSPDGQRIAFSSNRSGHWEIWVANADGSQARQVTAYAATPATKPRWSPDSRLIAFEHLDQGNRDVYTITPEGTLIRRLTSDVADEQSPAWSRDGRWLYYSSNRSGATEIWKTTLSQPAEVVRVTDGGGAFPNESPDGKFLYFSRGSGPTCEIWRMDVNGGQARRVLTCDGALRVPWWAPNQTGIYHLDPARGIVFHDGATHSVKTIVPLEPYSFVNGLAVSPDQRWLLYGKRDRTGSDIMIVENFN